MRALAALLVLAPGAAWAHGGSASMTGVAAAMVVAPLRVEKQADLDFGTIAHAPGEVGTVWVAPGVAGASYGGGAAAVGAGVPHPARFAVMGEAGRQYGVTVPAEVVAQGDGGAAPLQVDSLSVASASESGAIGRLDSGGSDSFTVGGRLILPAETGAAHYSAQIPVIVTYI